MARSRSRRRALATAALVLALSATLLCGSAVALDRTASLMSKPTGVADPNSGPVRFDGASQDGSRVFFTTDQSLTADDTDGGHGDVYERSGGVTRLVSKPTGLPDAGGANAQFAGASPDGSRVFFLTSQKMTTDDGDSGLQDVYERSGGTTKLVSKADGVADPGTGIAFFRGVSADGSRVFFESVEKLTGDDADAGRTDVYERAGGHTKLVSQPSGLTDPDTGAASFAGASHDGSRVFFTTTQQMATADDDVGLHDVYERAGATTTLVSTSTGVEDPASAGVLFGGASDDGTHVFFYTPQALTPDDADNNRNDVYERTGGVTTLVSQPTGVTDPDTGGANFEGASADGTRVLFSTSQKMTSDDGDTGLGDIYERSGGTTTLVSKPTGIEDPEADNVSYDGASRDATHVYFDTTQPMTPDDADSARGDVYERAGGTTTLVSQPTGVTDPDSDDPYFLGASADGSHVFFYSFQRMTAADNDTGYGDIYERSGGLTTLVSKAASGPDPDSGDTFDNAVISSDGRRVVFTTTEKLTGDDTDTGRPDVYAELPPPTAATAAATAVGTHGATLRGGVDPSGLATGYRFDFGKTTAYGAQTPSVSAGSGDAAVAVTKAVAGLEPSTTYHFRVRATNASGTVVGGDRTFKTKPVPPPADLSAVKSNIRVAKSRRFKIAFRATPGLTGRAVVEREQLELARKTFSVPAGGKVTLELRLSRKSFRTLKREHKLEARLTVTLKNAAGATSTARKAITLKAPKKKRHPN